MARHPLKWKLNHKAYEAQELRERRHKRLEQLVRGCNSAVKGTKDHLEDIEYKQLLNNIKQEEFAFASKTLQEIDGAHGASLQILYHYKLMGKHEKEEMAYEVEKHYR